MANSGIGACGTGKWILKTRGFFCTWSIRRMLMLCEASRKVGQWAPFEVISAKSKRMLASHFIRSLILLHWRQNHPLLPERGNKGK